MELFCPNPPPPPLQKKKKLIKYLNFLASKNLIKLFYTLYKTLLGETVCLSNLGTLLLTVQPLCDLLDTMPGDSSLSASHPTLPREAQDFLRGSKYGDHKENKAFCLVCVIPAI